MQRIKVTESQKKARAKAATAQARLSEFCQQLSAVLLRAGKSRASCMVPSSGPVISFAEWTERAIRKHSDMIRAATDGAAVNPPKVREP